MLPHCKRAQRKTESERGLRLSAPLSPRGARKYENRTFKYFMMSTRKMRITRRRLREMAWEREFEPLLRGRRAGGGCRAWNALNPRARKEEKEGRKRRGAAYYAVNTVHIGRRRQLPGRITALREPFPL